MSDTIAKLRDLLLNSSKAGRLRDLLDSIYGAASTGAEAYGSASSPMSAEHSGLLGGLLMDMSPLGDAKSAYDGVQSARGGDYLGAALGGLGALPMVPNLAGAIKSTSKFLPDPSVKLLPEPQSWYHGSPADVYASKEGWFKPVAGESGVPAVWGTRDIFGAEGYSRGEIGFKPDASGKYPLNKSWYKDYDGNGGVYSLIDNSKNPLIHDAEGKDWVRVPQGKIMREAKAKGHDSVVFKNISDNYDNSGITSDVIAWFDPSVISKARGSATTPVIGATALSGLLGLEAVRRNQNQ